MMLDTHPNSCTRRFLSMFPKPEPEKPAEKTTEAETNNEDTTDSNKDSA